MNKEAIENSVNSYLQGTEYFLVEVDVRKGSIIDVFVDGDKGISIAECVRISRFIEKQFDREAEDYELRVSSPGLDRPLKLPRQYSKYLDRAIEVVTANGEKKTGTLKSFNETGLTLERKTGKKGTEFAEEFFSSTDINEVKPGISFK